MRRSQFLFDFQQPLRFRVGLYTDATDSTSDIWPQNLEARDGIEPAIKVLQTFALPLGDRASELNWETNHS